MTRKKKIGVGCLAAFIVVGGVGWWFYGDLIRHFAPSLWRSVTDRPHEYKGTSIDNLKAMRNALLSYEESEGQFPEASGWMTAIEKRIVTDDLKSGESEKKLILPENVGQPGKFGYGFNASLSGKYHGDIKDHQTLMIYESVDEAKNASGDPAKAERRGGLAITLDGTIVESR